MKGLTSSAQFGLGRRACVGKYIAEASVWIVAATMLATLDIGKAVDADGKDIYPDPEFTDGLTWSVCSCPLIASC